MVDVEQDSLNTTSRWSWGDLSSQSYPINIFKMDFHQKVCLPTAPEVNILTRALLPQKFFPKGVELVRGGSVINAAYPI